MPTYKFKCKKCGYTWEEFRWMSQAFPPCPECGAQNTDDDKRDAVDKILTAPIGFKGLPTPKGLAKG